MVEFSIIAFVVFDNKCHFIFFNFVLVLMWTNRDSTSKVLHEHSTTLSAAYIEIYSEIIYSFNISKQATFIVEEPILHILLMQALFSLRKLGQEKLLEYFVCMGKEYTIKEKGKCLQFWRVEQKYWVYKFI